MILTLVGKSYIAVSGQIYEVLLDSTLTLPISWHLRDSKIRGNEISK